MVLNFDVDDLIPIRMNIFGTKLLFDTIYPSEQDLGDCPKIHLTSKRDCNPT